MLGAGGAGAAALASVLRPRVGTEALHCPPWPTLGPLLTRSRPSLPPPRPSLFPSLRGASSSSDSEDGDSLGSGGSAQVVPQRSTLDGLLLSEWEDRAERGLFRYDVTACPTRVLRGAYGFVAQLNEGRASKKRPTEFCVDVVAQPFDASKFNFTKALQAEVLFQFEPSAAARPAFAPAAPPAASPTLVLINVSPIEYGHCLLCPRALDGLNQLVAPDTMLTALKFAREADNPFFRLGFNSLGAYGTINHLHFQAYYLAAPFPCERAPTVPLPAYPDLARPRRRGGLRVCQLAQYPVCGLVFEAGDSLAEVRGREGCGGDSRSRGAGCCRCCWSRRVKSQEHALLHLTSFPPAYPSLPAPSPPCRWLPWWAAPASA